jgi:AcrR family transcriptional regulator
MSGNSKPSGKSNRRSEILKAADKLMRSRGLAGVTTRQISREVGCSEGALYVHFEGRLELLLAMLEECLPDMLEPLRDLRESIGSGDPQANLTKALGGIFNFHRRIVPAAAGLFAERDLLLAYRESLQRQNKGPHLSMAALAEYIAAEQKLKRIESGVDPKLAAYLLLSASFFRAFVEEFMGAPFEPSWERFARQLLGSIVPRPSSSEATSNRRSR